MNPPLHLIQVGIWYHGSLLGCPCTQDSRQITDLLIILICEPCKFGVYFPNHAEYPISVQKMNRAKCIKQRIYRRLEKDQVIGGRGFPTMPRYPIMWRDCIRSSCVQYLIGNISISIAPIRSLFDNWIGLLFFCFSLLGTFPCYLLHFGANNSHVQC